MMIVCHTRDDDNGWREMYRYEHDAPEWSEQEKVWINHMLDEGIDLLTCGCNMFQLIHDHKGFLR